VPISLTKKYGYLKGKVTLIGDDSTILFREVRGFAGSGKFGRWADANLPRLKDRLVGKLEDNVGKAIAEQERRDIRQIHGGR
jgi:hypothetical protein